MAKAKKKSTSDDEPGGEKSSLYLDKRDNLGNKFLDSIIFNVKKIINKPLKIAIITPQYVNKKGVSNKGVALHVFNLARELTKLGCEIHIFTGDNKKSRISSFQNDGKLVVHRINTKLEIFTDDYVVKKNLSRMTFETKAVNAIIREHNKGSFDLIHSHITYNGALMAKQLLNVRWVHTIHSIEKVRMRFMSKEERKFTKASKWQESALGCTDAVITVSKTLKESIVKDYGLNESKVFAIPNGVDKNIYKKDSIKKTNKVLYIGRFSMEKGIELLPEIINGVLSQDKEIIFEIVASLEENNLPEDFSMVQKKLEELEEKYSGRLIWHKADLARDEIAELYSEALIFIQPSLYDSFPTTMIEAMLFGKLVIGSDVGGIPELVGDAGIIVSPKPLNFINSILKLKDDYRLRERYSNRASDRAKNFFWDKIAKQTFELYQLLAKKQIKKNENLGHIFKNLEKQDE